MKGKIIGIGAAVLALVSGISAIFIFAGNKIGGFLGSAPENIVYNGEYISWDECTGAMYYNVTIDEGTAVRANTTRYNYQNDGSFTATVSAVYDDDKEKSASVTFNPLAKIEKFDVSDSGTVSWEPITGATAYLVSINGQEKTITGTSVEFKSGTNTIKVKPIVSGDKSYYSFWSAQRDVKIFAAPSDIDYDGAVITWRGSADSYEVSVNGTKEVVKGNKYPYSADQRDFSIEVKALGDHKYSFDSVNVEQDIKFLQMVSALYVEDGVLKWNEIAGATGYKIKINGVEKSIKENCYENIVAGQEQRFAVMPINDSGNAKYFSKWSAEQSVYILKAPVIKWNSDIAADEGNGNANVTWDAVSEASGYEVRFTKHGKKVEVDPTSIDGNCFKNPYSEVGEYTVEVKAKADASSGDKYDSKYSSMIKITRLPAPAAAATDFIVSDKNNLQKGFTVNFSQVPYAHHYDLYKEDVLQNGKISTTNQIIVNDVVASDTIDERKITYSIRSAGKNEATRLGDGTVTAVLPSLEKLTFEITVKATPRDLDMSGTKLSWGSVSGNNGYSVSMGSGSYVANSESYDLSGLKAGSYRITVSSLGNGAETLASNPSAPITVSRLATPSIRRINRSDNGTIELNEIKEATGYSLYFDENLDNAFKDQKSIKNVYSKIKTEGTTLAIVAEANRYNADRTVYFMSSERSVTKTFIKLKAPVIPEGALSTNTSLTWNAPTNVEGYTPAYEVYESGVEVGTGTVSGTTYSLAKLEAGNYAYSIRAIGDGTRYVDSDMSAEINFTKIEVPDFKIDRENKCYAWNAVSGATSYYLEIDGKKVSDDFNMAGKNFTYVPRYTNAGNHTVKLTAVGDGKTYISSKTYEFTQVVKLLTSPKAEGRYSSDRVDPNNGKVTVDITSEPQNCTRYEFTIGGVTCFGNEGETSYTKDIKHTGEVSISVKALGGNFDENDVYYADAGRVTDIKSIILLGKINRDSIQITGFGKIKWGAVNSSKGYDYRISYDGGEYGEVMHTGKTEIQIGEKSTDYKTYKSIKIMVCASGNGDSQYVDSEWTEFEWTNPN